MKSNRTNRFLGLLGRFFTASAIVMSFFGLAQAGNLYWDGGTTDVADPGDGTSFGGLGTWNATLKNWDNGATHQAWANATTDTAIFGGATSGVVTLGSAVTANGLTFNTAGYTVSGANTLTLAGTTPTITANADATISSVVAGTVGLAKAGTGILTLSGANTYTGATTITAGTLTLGTGTVNGTFGAGTYAISGGATLRTNSATTAIKPAWANISGAATSTFSLRSAGNGDWGQAALPATFLGKLRIESGRVYASATAGTNTYGLGVPSSIEVLPGGQLGLWQAAGTLTQNMSIAGTGYGETNYEAAIRLGATTLSGTITLAGNTTLAAAGTAILSNGLGQSTPSDFTAGTPGLTGTIELRGVNTYTGNTILKTGALVIGSSAGASSASIYGGSIVNQLTLTGGTLRLASTGVPHTISGTVGGTGGNINVSGTSAAAATLNVVAGASMTPNQITVGDSGGMGIYTQTGGTVATGNAGNLWVANQPAGSGSIATISGGTLNGGTGTSVLGVRGSYVFTVSGTAAVTMGTLQLGHAGGTSNNPAGRIINLDGGSLTLSTGLSYPVSGNNAPAVINFNGAQLTVGTGSAISSAVSGTVKAGGAKINVGASNLILGGALTHDAALGATADGGLIKTGDGTLTLAGAATYTGPTMVNAGALILPETAATNDIQVATSAALTIAGSTGATIGGVTPITSLTVGSSAGAGTATLSFGNFASGSSALVQAEDFVPQGTIGPIPAPNTSPTGGVTINLTGGTFTGPGTFPLIWVTVYTELGGDGFRALSLGALPRNVEAYLSNADPTAVDLVVTGFKPTTWVGDESAVWDINTTQNWTVNSVKDVYKDGDAILFDASPAGAGPIGVTLNTTVAPFGMTVNGAKDYAFTGSGAIGGNASIAKNGAATLTLGTNNTFTGTTSVNVGTVKIGHANALGTAASALDGTTVATGAALDLNGTAIPAEYLTLGGTGIGGTGALLSSNLITPASTAGPITLTSATTIGGPGGLTLSGAIAQGANLLTLSNTGTATLALSGVMTGSGGLAVGGTGTTTVSSPMTFTGAAGLAVTNTGTTTISGGITGAASNVALSGNGPTTLSGASNLGTGNITVGGSAATTITNAITSTGSLAKSGAGTLTLSAKQAYTGGTTVNGGVLDLTGGGGAGGTIRGTVDVNPTGTLRISTGDATGYDLNTPRLTAINLVGGTVNVNTTGNQTLGAATFTMTGGLLTGVPGSNLDFFTSDNAQPGRSALTTLASATTSVVSGVKLNMRQNDGVVFTVADGDAPIDLDVQSNISSSAFTNNQLVKNGPGTMRLSGLSTYAYPTVINAGAMIVPAVQSSTGYTLADGTALSIIGTPGSTFSTGTATLGSAGATTVNVLNFGGQPLPANAPVKLSTSLALNSVLTLNVNGVFPAAGVYPLVSYPAGGVSGTGSVALGSLPPNVTATLEETATGINLNISEVNPLVWAGTVFGGVWDVNNTANWVPIASSPLGKYLENMVVLLDDSDADTTVALNSVVTPSGVTVNNPTKPYTIAGTGGISGTGPLTKTGAELLTLATANTYIGTTTINGGTLQLGTGVLDGSITGAIVNNASLVFNPGVTQTLPGAISGTGSLTKTGPGTTVLSGATTYTGATTISGGTLQVATGTLTTGPVLNNANLVFTRTVAGATNPAGVISGSGNVAYTGPAVMTSGVGEFNVDDVNLYSGTTTIGTSRAIPTNSLAFSTGAITITDGGQIYNAAPNGTVFNNPMTLNGLGWPEGAGQLGALRLSNGVTIAGPITLGSNSRISVYGSFASITGAIGGNYDIEFSGNTKADQLHLTGPSVNTYTGKTIINSGGVYLNKIGTPAFFTNVQMGGGTTAQPHLRMLASNQFGPGVELTHGNVGGNWARFEMQGTNQTFTGISTGTLTTQGGTVIQNRSLDDTGSNWGTSTLTLNGSGNYVYNGHVRDSDNPGASATNMLALNKTGTGTQTLVGTVITHTGNTAVAAGTLQLTNTTAFASNIDVSGSAVLEFNSTAANDATPDWPYAKTLTGAGTVNKTGTGWVYINNGTVAMTGQINVQSGILSVGGTTSNWTANTASVDVSAVAKFDLWAVNGTIGGLTGAGTVSNGTGTGTYTLTVGAGDKGGSFAGVIQNTTGTLALIKTGTGKQTLSGVSTYTGATTINGGTLALSGTGSIDATTAVTIAPGAVFDVSATTSGGFIQATAVLPALPKTFTGGRTSGTGNDVVGNLTSGSTVNVAGYGTVGTLTVSGDLTLSGGGTLQLDLSGSTVSGNDQLVTGGALNLTDAGVTTVTPVFNGAPVVGTAYPIIAYNTGAAPVGTGTFVASLPAGSGITGATFDTSVAGKVLMTLDGETKALVWSGATAGVWSTDATQLNWNGPGTPTMFRNLDSVQFLDIAATATMTVNVGNIGNLTATPASILVNNKDTAYTFATTAAGVIAGGATLTKTGTGALTIANANTFSGGTVLSQGTLTLTNVTAAGSGPIILGDAGTGANNLLFKANVGSGVFANPITVSASGSGSVTIDQYIALSSLSGTLTLNRATTIEGGPDRTGITGKITGTVGTLTFAGVRTTLNSPVPNDFTGNVIINTGATAQINDMNSLPGTANVTASGTLRVIGGANSVVTIGALNGAGTVNGDSGGGNYLKTLSLGNNGDSGNFTGAISNGSGTDTLALIKVGVGTQTLGGTTTFTGTTRILGGTLALTNSLALAGSTLVWDNLGGTLNCGTLTAVSIGALQGAQNLSLMNNDTVPAPMALTLGGGNVSTSYSGAILGGTTLTKTGTGHQILSGAGSNTYTGLTSLVNGRLGLEKAGAIAIPGSITITNNEGVHLFTLADNQFAAGSVLTMSGGTGNSRFELLGTTQTFAGLANDGTGRGVVQVREQVGQLVISPLSTLILDVPVSTTYSFNGYLRNNGGTMKVIKNGLGKQTLNGAPDRIGFSGGLIVNAGIIEFGGNSTDNIGGFITINAGATVQGIAATNIVCPLNMNGATLAGVGAYNATYGHFVLANTLTVRGTATSLVSGSIHMANARTMDVGVTGDASGIDLDIPGQLGNIEGSTWGTLNKTGAGTLRISNPANLLGGVTVNTGKVIFKDAMAGLANTGLVNNSIVDADMGTAVSATFAGPMTGTGVFNKNGVGTLTRTGGGAYTGNINLTDGKLIAKAAGSLGAVSNARLITVAAGKTLEFQVPNVFGGHNTLGAPIVVNAGGMITNFDSLGTARINNGLGNLTLNSATLTSIAGNNLAGDVSSSRPNDVYGAWGLNGTVTSTGNSFISTTAPGAAGRVLLNSNPAATPSGDTVINVVDGTLTISTTLQGGDGDAGGLNKSGVGKLVLSAVNVYRGPTTVNAGILELTGSLIATDGPATTPSNITVGGAGTLKGTGTATGSLTVNGIVAPGTSIGTLAVGATTFGATGSLTAEINSTTKTADRLAVTGDLTIDPDATLTLTDLGAGTPANAKLVLLTYSGVWNSTPFFGKPDDSTVVVNGNSYTLNYDDFAMGYSAVTLTLGAGDPFDAWAKSYGLTGNDALKGSDPDQDGYNNLLEFATNSDPSKGGSGPRVYPLMFAIGADNALTYTLAVRKDAVFATAANPDQKKQTATKDVVVYTIEASNDLVTWNAVEVTEVTGATATAVQTALGGQLAAPPIGADWTWHTFRTDGGAAVDPNDSIRLKVAEAP
jgi:autotransporter-associated beta strand protein